MSLLAGSSRFTGFFIRSFGVAAVLAAVVQVQTGTAFAQSERADGRCESVSGGKNERVSTARFPADEAGRAEGSTRRKPFFDERRGRAGR